MTIRSRVKGANPFDPPGRSFPTLHRVTRYLFHD
jgi:hypothetical protein